MHDNGKQSLEKIGRQCSFMLDNSPIQMWFLSGVDTYGIVNQCHADFLGRTKQEIEFRRLEEFLPEEVVRACLLSNQEVFDSRRTIHSEIWLPDSNGRKRLMKITKTPLFDKNGNIESIGCYGVDITDQKRVERGLTQSEDNFRTFIETIHDIVLVGKPDGTIIYSNPAASSKLGYAREEFNKKKIIDMHPGYVQREAVSILSDMIRGRKEVCLLPLIDKTGQVVPVETRVWGGKWNGANCIFWISKSMSREREALQKFDRFFRMNPALLAVSKLPELTFTEVNDAFLRTLGYSRNEVIGRTSSELGLFVDDQEQQQASRILAEYGKIREIELQIRTRKGETLCGLFSGELIENQGVKYFLTVMLDITARKKAEVEYQKTINELRIALSEIKTLRGILPICINCKKIRDDKGYWEQVEYYVTNHTEALFSHGICPECLIKHYPEYSEDEDV